MKPGPELDALVAERVMGWPAGMATGSCNGQPIYDHPPYSTGIAAVWLVVATLKAHEHYISFAITDEQASSLASYTEHDGEWFAGVCLGRGLECAAGESAAHAICLAALKAVGYETN